MTVKKTIVCQNHVDYSLNFARATFLNWFCPERLSRNLGLASDSVHFHKLAKLVELRSWESIVQALECFLQIPYICIIENENTIFYFMKWKSFLFGCYWKFATSSAHSICVWISYITHLSDHILTIYYCIHLGLSFNWII